MPRVPLALQLYSVRNELAADTRGTLKAVADMGKRVRAAVADKPMPTSIDYEAYESWLERNLTTNRQYIDYLENQGVLSRIERQPEIDFKKSADVPDGLWDMMRQYMDEDITADPYFCEVEPFCYFGGEAIYFLRKGES